MTAPPKLSSAEYLAIEESIAGDSKGRAFLRERDARSRVVGAERVRQMLRQLIIIQKSAPTATTETEHIRILGKELQEISSYIQQTRSEIAALRPDQSGNSRIVLAAGELDAIVSATERATSEILNGAERIQAAVGRFKNREENSAAVAEIENQVIEIMTACGFQDITGQRTTKVVNALRYIETRINAMIAIWGVESSAPSVLDADHDTRPDAHLLNGPQLEGGVSQGDVDALFATAGMHSGVADQNAIDQLFD